MPDTVREEAARALTLLGSAWRGDWMGFDGRTLRSQLADVTQALLQDDPEFDGEQYARGLGICPDHGCWTEHCRNRDHDDA